MDEYTRINATVVSHIGILPTENKDNFYINGRFGYEHETGNIQVSIDNEETGFLFAVMANMEKNIGSNDSGLSMPKELRKLHRNIIQSGRGVQVKVTQLSELVNEVSNIIQTEDDELEPSMIPSFAGLILEENVAIAVNKGVTKIFLMRNSNFSKIVGDDSKTETMLKMGIITDEQAEYLEEDDDEEEETLNNTDSVEESELIKLKNDDLFLVCTDGLLNAIDEEQIFEIMSMRSDTGVIANMLIREAVRKSDDENITVMVVRVDDVSEESEIDALYVNNMKNKASLSKEKAKNVVQKPEEDTKRDDIGDDVTRKISIDKLYEKQAFIPEKSTFPKLKKYTDDDSKKRRTINLIKRIITFTVFIVIIFAFAVMITKWFKGIAEPDKNDNDFYATHATKITETTFAETETVQTEEPTTEEIETTAATTTQKETTAPVISEWPKEYTVKSGDSLRGIAYKFYNDETKYKIIMTANNITDPNYIKIGQELTIPAP